ncbi:hypothetical protein [Mycolicibacterium sp. 050158]|uniref:hypothetical protein n=1 Tax=Mycolicibacterium sp. 050158 TaxID=3090602 RepID=UPI00299E3953|nr:hypothetical protein [Mycolicibacterium sp. 050158]MDX1892887.1 hypothetical protein [Mycolicibacterium sp. 050158]
MRVALVVAASALLAGCSGDGGGSAEHTAAPATSSSATISVPSRSATPTSAPPSLVPAAGAPIADVIAWIEAGEPADAAAFHTMTRGGETTDLGDGVAFVAAGNQANCVTNEHLDGALACLVKLSDPPPRPAGIETAWKDNWVDFPGATVDVGSPHGDPGPFVNGTGSVLPAGRTLAFGDYRCRADAAALYCVDYAHQSAVEMSTTGVQGFGCLQKVTPPADIGIRLSC